MQPYKRDINRNNISEGINDWWFGYCDDDWWDWEVEDYWLDNIIPEYKTEKVLLDEPYLCVHSYRGCLKRTNIIRYAVGNKVDMESFYDKKTYRDRRIDFLLNGNPDKNKNLLGDYFNN